jgi:AhpD family alkylhydroperoxidase
MEEWMETRLDYGRVAPGAIRAMVALERYVKEETDLEPELVELVKLRASQINGCAYCIDMHTKDARAAGTEEQRLYLLSAWREAPFYTERERAALAWAEAVTLVSESGVGDEVYAFAREHFSEKELVDLTIVLTAINGWNRLSISFRPEVGIYRSPAAAEASKAGGEG